jgi:serine/threonine-protein kinase
MLAGYRIVERLGSGGYGEVYLATCGEGAFRRRCAIKRYDRRHSAAGEIFNEAFLTEIQLGGWLRHPSIVQTIDAGVDGEHCFLVLEYVDGSTLRNVINHCARRGGRLPPSVALEMMEQVLGALDYAHQFCDPEGRPLAIVHRDVKPSNLMLTRDGRVKVMDFGIAQVQLKDDEDATPTEVRGSPGYMSPEQVRGEPDITPASDIFVCGAILYELLTTRQLFEAGSASERMYRIANADLDATLEAVDSVVRGVGPILRWALRHEPEQRWGRAYDMASAIASLRDELNTVMSMRTFAGAWFAMLDLEGQVGELSESSSDTLTAAATPTSRHIPSTVITLPTLRNLEALDPRS